MLPWTVQNAPGTPVQLGILNQALIYLIVFIALTFAIVYGEKAYDFLIPKILERVFNDKEW